MEANSRAATVLLLLVAWVVCTAAASRLSAAGLGGVLNADPKSFPLQTGTAFTETRYVQFIQSIRDHIKSKSTNQAHGITVLPTVAEANKLPAADQYFLVVLSNEVAGRQVTVGVRLQNLYVVGYKYGTNSYFFSDEYATASTVLFAGTTKTKLSYTGSYPSLQQRAGAGRNSIKLGNWALSGTIDSLANLKAGDDKTQARAFTVIIQMVSEAVRFQSIQTQVSRAVSVDFTPSTNLIELENNWGKLSSAVINSGANGIISPPITIGTVVISSAQQAAKELKIAANIAKVTGEEKELEAVDLIDSRSIAAGGELEELIRTVVWRD